MNNFIIAYCKALLIPIFMITTLLGLFGCAANNTKTITSLESMTLILQGMRGSSVYEVISDSQKTELNIYREAFSNGEYVLKLEKSTVCDTQEFIKLMNDCNVIRWDGFHGKHPRNVKDGIMFDFTASVNEGQTIHADGSANFPKGYNEFVRALNDMLTKSETTE